MSVSSPSNCLQIFFADMQTHGIWPVLSQMQQEDFRYLGKHEAAEAIRDVTNALNAAGVTPKTHVAFHAEPSIELWACEWGVLANRSVAVIIPCSFDVKELIETLA